MLVFLLFWLFFWILFSWGAGVTCGVYSSCNRGMSMMWGISIPPYQVNLLERGVPVVDEDGVVLIEPGPSHWMRIADGSEETRRAAMEFCASPTLDGWGKKVMVLWPGEGATYAEFIGALDLTRDGNGWEGSCYAVSVADPDKRLEDIPPTHVPPRRVSIPFQYEISSP